MVTGLIVGGIIFHVCMLVDHAMYTHIIAFKLLNRKTLGMCKNMRRYESYLYSLQRFFVIQARVDRVGILQTVKPDTNDSQRDYAISQKMSHISKRA